MSIAASPIAARSTVSLSEFLGLSAIARADELTLFVRGEARGGGFPGVRICANSVLLATLCRVEECTFPVHVDMLGDK